MPQSQPIKIMFVITQGEYGGAQRYVFDLATNLPKNFTAVAVIGAEKTELQTKLEGSGIEIIVAGHLKRDIRPLHDLLSVFELRGILRAEKPDIVHLNSSKAGVVGSIAARLAGIRNVIFTAHGFAFLEPNSWVQRQLYYWTERLASLFRRKIICVSEFDKQAAIKSKLCPPEKLIMIHNGIESGSPPIYGPMNLSSTPIGDRQATKPVTIGTIAHLYKTKGLEYLVEAAEILNHKSQITNHKFVVIGEGTERQKLESRIKNYGLENKFKLLGAKENAAAYLPQFDIFVLPSVKEGFPYTILEAMAAGLPIVATATGGIPEAITPSLSPPVSLREIGGDEVGVLVPPADPKTLAQAINFLIANPDVAKRIAQNARERVKEFSLDKMLAETIKVYGSTGG